MFELEKAIVAWREAVVLGDFASEARIAELEDHLRCGIEELRAAGLSEEDAFKATTHRLGSLEELVREYAKNRGVLSRLYAFEKKLLGASISGGASSKRQSLGMIANSIIWAATMLAVALILDDAEEAAFVGTVLLAGWFASFILQIPASQLAVRAECAYLRRILGRLKAH